MNKILSILASIISQRWGTTLSFDPITIRPIEFCARFNQQYVKCHAVYYIKRHRQTAERVNYLDTLARLSVNAIFLNSIHKYLLRERSREKRMYNRRSIAYFRGTNNLIALQRARILSPLFSSPSLPILRVNHAPRLRQLTAVNFAMNILSRQCVQCTCTRCVCSICRVDKKKKSLRETSQNPELKIHY